MRNIRTALGALTALLLFFGYAASQYAAMVAHDPSQYAARVDQPQVRALATILFVLALVFAFIPDRTEAK